MVHKKKKQRKGSGSARLLTRQPTYGACYPKPPRIIEQTDADAQAHLVTRRGILIGSGSQHFRRRDLYQIFDRWHRVSPITRAEKTAVVLFALSAAFACIDPSARALKMGDIFSELILDDHLHAINKALSFLNYYGFNMALGGVTGIGFYRDFKKLFHRMLTAHPGTSFCRDRARLWASFEFFFCSILSFFTLPPIYTQLVTAGVTGFAGALGFVGGMVLRFGLSIRSLERGLFIQYPDCFTSTLQRAQILTIRTHLLARLQLLRPEAERQSWEELTRAAQGYGPFWQSCFPAWALQFGGAVVMSWYFTWYAYAEATEEQWLVPMAFSLSLLLFANANEGVIKKILIQLAGIVQALPASMLGFCQGASFWDAAKTALGYLALLIGVFYSTFGLAHVALEFGFSGVLTRHTFWQSMLWSSLCCFALYADDGLTSVRQIRGLLRNPFSDGHRWILRSPIADKLDRQYVNSLSAWVNKREDWILDIDDWHEYFTVNNAHGGERVLMHTVLPVGLVAALKRCGADPFSDTMTLYATSKGRALLAELEAMAAIRRSEAIDVEQEFLNHRQGGDGVSDDATLAGHSRRSVPEFELGEGRGLSAGLFAFVPDPVSPTVPDSDACCAQGRVMFASC